MNKVKGQITFSTKLCECKPFEDNCNTLVIAAKLQGANSTIFAPLKERNVQYVHANVDSDQYI